MFGFGPWGWGGPWMGGFGFRPFWGGFGFRPFWRRFWW